jgi:putative methionine-R-sulfoxide reductase with GAF domain
MQTALQSILTDFGCQTGTVHLTGEDGQLKLVAHIGVPDFILPKISSIPFGKGIAGCAAERKEAVQLCNLQTDTSGVARPDAKATQVSGALAVPLISADGKVRGVLGIGKVIPYEFTAEETAKLKAHAQTIVSTLG